MREMSDHDILLDRTKAQNVKKIMESLGFSTKNFGRGTHDVYYRKPLCNFEMHRDLFGISFDERIHDCSRVQALFCGWNRTALTARRLFVPEEIREKS